MHSESSVCRASLEEYLDCILIARESFISLLPLIKVMRKSSLFSPFQSASILHFLDKKMINTNIVYDKITYEKNNTKNSASLKANG